MEWETIIGIEVHAELATKSKIFCSCSTKYGQAPNSQTCPICLGHPGSLPTLNQKVVELATRAGLALNCHINHHNKFDRKNYYYPDLPKAYQITQLYTPLCENGYLEITTETGEKKIKINNIHIEEDAGKLIHDASEEWTLIDYNRSGVPLIEIVSEPDFRNANEVIAFIEKLKETLLYLEISDCKMQEGSLRADINLSIRPTKETKLGTRTEIKNMNSLKAIKKAIDSETKRQIQIKEKGGEVTQETRRWDESKNESSSMRTKENTKDYRYFPDPDLPPIEINQEWLTQIKKTMPELAEVKRKRYIKQMEISEKDANKLTTSKQISKLFEETSAISQLPKETANIITNEIMYLMKSTNTPPDKLNIDSKKLAEVIILTKEGSINRNTAKEVCSELFKTGIDPKEYINTHKLSMTNDNKHIENTIKQILDSNKKAVTDYHSGKEKALTHLIGQTMKALKGKGNPQTINQILKEKLACSIEK